jgi:hypothetical protein
VKQNNALIILFLLTGCCCFSQQKEQRLRGKVVSDSIELAGITVMNLVNEQITATDSKGEFSIMAKEEDMLIFSSVNYEYKRRIIEAEDIKEETLLIKLTPKVTQLDEVVVRRDINPESLGIVPAGQKKYTPAQRRLKTAAEFKPEFLLGILGGNIPVDPLINAITGRTARLKKEVKVEKKQMDLEKIATLFEDDYYTDKLKIPVESIKGFQYYLVDDKDFVAGLDSGNKALIQLSMSQLALTYKDILIAQDK